MVAMSRLISPCADESFTQVAFMRRTVLPKESYFFTELLPFVGTDKRLTLLGDLNCVCSVTDRDEANIYIDQSARVLDEIN